MTRLPAPLTLSCPAGSGAVRTYGAHVMSWAPTGFDPVLWVSSRAKDSVGEAIRGGVPICFPWFGPGRSGDLKPAHGFARITEWKLADRTSDNDGAAATARFILTHEDINPQLRSVFPHPFRAAYTVAAGAELSMSLTVTNTGPTAFEFEEALHTYLSVGDSRRISIEGLDGARYFDKVTQQQQEQAGPIAITDETDRVYYSDGTVQVKDPAMGRTLTVAKEGSDNTVVWNPWTEKSKAMGDFADDEWQSMVCVETANVLDNAVRLDAGESHTMTQILSVSLNSLLR
ncbi:D-hexose-6-phosphate mutarotase [Kocuria sp. cx-455]|uniref:D-hexose-6-phosphate mutarotase n=1 Tax=Kocuria sp. cx-455 TaxID=2771377 RepID=UPI0016896864|nr:D-hexose-6-phosphate mutarotase [Kocuria sp. cx-455]MBD2764098.1 D-hexose-6-phosphate mutarotase [Kocuria sp. cx-455]